MKLFLHPGVFTLGFHSIVHELKCVDRPGHQAHFISYVKDSIAKKSVFLRYLHNCLLFTLGMQFLSCILK